MKYFITLPALGLSMVCLYLVQMTAVCAADITVDTQVAGMRVNTRLDSAIARDILTGANWPADIRAVHNSHCSSIEAASSPAALQTITRQYSVDTATALLLRCLENLPSVRESQSMFLSELAGDEHNNKLRQTYLATRASQYLILFVPGWGYQSSGDVTGSNLARPRAIVRAMGFESHLVPLADFGSIESNAALLAANLQHHLAAGKQVILASASSGGPAVALALGQPDIGLHPNLRGWINICGVLRGSPVVDRFANWPASLLPRVLSLFEGWTYSEFLSMSRPASDSRFSKFAPPPQLTVLNYIGVPFSSQVSRTGRTLYRLIDHLGPNDGLTLITDALAPGYTVLAVGSDHFVREDPEIDRKTAALLPLILRLIENDLESRSAVAAYAGTQLP